MSKSAFSVKNRDFSVSKSVFFVTKCGPVVPKMDSVSLKSVKRKKSRWAISWPVKKCANVCKNHFLSRT